MFHQLQSCKEKLWKRWYQEYLLALRERHQCTNDKGSNLDIGDVVQIKKDQKNRGEWHVGIITKVVKINNVTVGAKIKLGTGTILERPIQMLHPLELQSERIKMDHAASKDTNEKEESSDIKTVNPNEHKNSARKAKTKAKERIRVYDKRTYER